MIAMGPNDIIAAERAITTTATTMTSAASMTDDEDSYLTIDGVYSEDDEETAEENETTNDDDDNDIDGTCSIVDANEIKKIDSNNNEGDISKDIKADNSSKTKNEDNNNNEDEDADDDDDDDDNVTITINAEKIEEHTRLIKLLRTNQLDVLEQNQVQQYVETDLELQREIEMIVRESIQPNTNKCIAVMLNNQIILIPNNIRISDRLASYIWGTAKQYTNQLFPYSHEFDLLLKGLSQAAINRRMFVGIPSAANVTLPTTFAIFAVRYVRTNCLAPKSQRTLNHHHLQHQSSLGSDNNNTHTFNNVLINTSNNNNNNNNSYINNNAINLNCNVNIEKKMSTIMGLYQYCDFSIIMIRDNCVVDYAIHGVHSNIAEVIERHQPEAVYYNAQMGDALDTFVKYEWQPFYECLRNVAKPISIYRNTRELFNTLPFCQRCDTFCAFCHALRDTRSLIAQPWQAFKLSFPPPLPSPPPTPPPPLMSLPIIPIHHKQYSIPPPSLSPASLLRYEPYRKIRNGKNIDWKYYARSRRPRRLSMNRFNYNSNCASFRF